MLRDCKRSEALELWLRGAGGLVVATVTAALKPNLTPINKLAARAAPKSYVSASAVGAFEKDGVLKFAHLTSAVDDKFVDASFDSAFLTAEQPTWIDPNLSTSLFRRRCDLGRCHRSD